MVQTIYHKTISMSRKGNKKMKNILITGGSRGIGAAMVKEFAKEGYRVFFTYKNSYEKALALATETGATAFVYDDTKNLHSEITKHGGLYALINNAGISEQKMFQDITESDWDNMFDSNIKNMFLTTKAYVSDMINKKCGRIINISSIWGISGASCEVHYSASKAAVIGFSKALSKELGPSGITVNCIAPGVIDTDMNKMHGEDVLKELTEETPIGRLGTPEEVAKLAIYLCSEAAAFVTGQTITMDGGFLGI